MAVSSVRVDRVLVIHPDAQVRHQIEGVLRRVHSHSIATRHTETATAAVTIAREFDPRIVFLDLGREGALALTAAREIRREGRRLIGLFNPLAGHNGTSEADFLRQAIRAGVDDFVPLPLSEPELAAALAAGPELASSRLEGKTVTFFSHQGGVGTTTLAVNTALAIANGKPNGTVTLVDANVQFGAVAAHLGLSPEHDLGDVVRDLELGPMFPLPSAGLGSGVALVASPMDPEVAARVTPEDLSRVVIDLRRRHAIVVADTAPVLDLMTLSVLDLSEVIVVVTEGSTPIVAGTARLLRMLASLGFEGDRLRLVVSRFRSAPDVLPPNVIATQLGRSVDYVVPYITPVQAGTHRGVPALSERGAAPFTEAVLRIAGDVGSRRLER